MSLYRCVALAVKAPWDTVLLCSVHSTILMIGRAKRCFCGCRGAADETSGFVNCRPKWAKAGQAIFYTAFQIKGLYMAKGERQSISSPLHKAYRGSRGTAPFILNVGITCGEGLNSRSGRFSSAKQSP